MSSVTSDVKSLQSSGMFSYSWIIILEILVLYLMGFGKIVKTLAEERKSGLFDLNRLTPLKPSDIALGYWFGPSLEEFYVGIVLVIFGVIIVVLGRLLLMLFILTQISVWSAALIFVCLRLWYRLLCSNPEMQSFFQHCLAIYSTICRNLIYIAFLSIE